MNLAEFETVNFWIFERLIFQFILIEIKKKNYHIFAYKIMFFIREFIWQIFNDGGIYFSKKRFSISKMIHSHFILNIKILNFDQKQKCIQSMDGKWSKTTDWLSLPRKSSIRVPLGISTRLSCVQINVVRTMKRLMPSLLSNSSWK